MTGLTKFTLASKLEISMRTLSRWVRSFCDAQLDEHLYEVYLHHRVLPPPLAMRLCHHFGV